MSSFILDGASLNCAGAVVARLFFQRIKSLAQWLQHASDEPFSEDGTVIDA